jgi:hypothetical protein
MSDIDIAVSNRMAALAAIPRRHRTSSLFEIKTRYRLRSTAKSVAPDQSTELD